MRGLRKGCLGRLDPFTTQRQGLEFAGGTARCARTAATVEDVGLPAPGHERGLGDGERRVGGSGEGGAGEDAKQVGLAGALV